VDLENGLETTKIESVVHGLQEDTGLINRTATPLVLASLALYETHQLAVLSQLLTILASEALGCNLKG